MVAARIQLAGRAPAALAVTGRRLDGMAPPLGGGQCWLESWLPHAAANHSNLTGIRSVHFPPRHHRNAPTLLHQRNLLCHERDTSFFRSRSLLVASVGQCARQAPHAPPGCFPGARVAPEFSTVVTPQIPSTLRALRATIPVQVRGACL